MNKDVKEEEEEEEREEVEKVEEVEKDKITTTTQFPTAMQQNCTHAQGNCFFPVNKEEEKKK